MPANANIHRVSLSIMVVIAMVAVLLPVCMLVDCGMGASDMLSAHGPGLSEACVNGMSGGAPAAVVGPGQQPLILTLVAAFGVVFAMVLPPTAGRVLSAIAEDPPPPPTDPRGVRLIV